MPLQKQDIYTTEYIEALPEGKRAELIDGSIYDLAAPSRIHQDIVSYLTQTIRNHITDKALPCRVYPGPFAVFLGNDEYTYVEPDLSVICNPDRLSERGCEGAPDWIIEIVSPASQRMDYMIKLNKYRQAGVRLYWIIDPEVQAVMVYDFEHDDMHRYRFHEFIPVSLYDGYMIRMSDFSK